MRSTLAASIVIATTVVTSFLMPPQPGNPLTPGAGGAALPDAPGAVREEVKGVPVVRDEDPADAAVRAALEKPVGEVNLEDVPLADVFAYLRELAGVNVIVEWTSLEAAGIERDRPVSVKLNSVKTGAALRAVLNLVGGSEVTLDYQIRDGILTIATAECLARHAEARLYCCSDLLRRPPPQWVQVEFDRSIAELRRSYGRESATFVEPKSAEIMNAIIERRTAELLDVIHNTVDPESWKTNGGAVGAITLLDDVLVIVQTQKNHEAIDRLLRNLLRARATANTAQ